MTATIEEIDLSTFEDIAPPCDYQEHGEHGTGAAVWAWTLRSVGPCGCPRPQTVVLICEGCWDYLNSGEKVYCTYCGVATTVAAETVSLVRL